MLLLRKQKKLIKEVVCHGKNQLLQTYSKI